ncbi:MAG: CHASE domain-containing protein, partial [Vicinamibacteria bacterium]
MFANAREHNKIKLEFEQQSAEVARVLELDLWRYLEALESIRQLYASSVEVTREEFRTFSAPLISRYSGLRGLSWSPRVPNTQRALYEGAAQKEGYPDFELKERDSEGRLVRAGDRAEWTPVYFIEPRGENEAALGFDLASEPVRLEALERARRSSEPAATPRLSLRHNTDERSSVLIFLPVYYNGRPHETMDERERNIEGYIGGEFRPGDVFRAAVQPLEHADLTMRLFDEAAPRGQRLLYAHPANSTGHSMEEENDESAIGIGWSRSLDVAGRNWLLRIDPASDYLVSHRSGSAWMVLAGMLLFTGLLQSFLLVLTGTTDRVERLVAERTAELASTNETLSKEIVSRREAEEKALTAAKVKTEFTSMVSHELRTPLAAIKDGLDIVLDGTAGPLQMEQDDYLQTAKRNVDRLTRLINTVLDFQKLEANRTEFDMKPENVNALILETMEGSSLVAAKKGLILRSRLENALPLVPCDRDKIIQV